MKTGLAFFFDAEMGLFGWQSAVISCFLGWYWTLFTSADQFYVRLAISYNFFCVTMADCISCNSHWIVHQATLDHCPTIGDIQFVMSVVGWSTLRHLEFSYISAGLHWMTTENWPRVDWSIRQFWQIGWWRTDHIWIMLNIYCLSVNKQRPGRRRHTGDFFRQ